MKKIFVAAPLLIALMISTGCQSSTGSQSGTENAVFIKNNENISYTPSADLVGIWKGDLHELVAGGVEVIRHCTLEIRKTGSVTLMSDAQKIPVGGQIDLLRPDRGYVNFDAIFNSGTITATGTDTIIFKNDRRSPESTEFAVFVRVK